MSHEVYKISNYFIDNTMKLGKTCHCINRALTKSRNITFLFMLFAKSFLIAQPFGYAYAKSITINSTVVTGTTNLVNFPFLLEIVDPDFKSTANGGLVENANGFDIVFTTDACAIDLHHHLEKYDPLTGEVVCWVNLPVLSYSVNTIINVYFGNSTVTLPTSSPLTWSSDYSSVLHLGNDPTSSAPQMIDDTGNGNSGTCNGSMTGTNSVDGKIATCLTFDEIDDGVTISDFDYSQSFTISFWFNEDEVNGTSFQYMYSHGNFGTFNSTNIYFGEDNLSFATDQEMLKTIFQDSNDATSTAGLDAGTTYVDGNWHYYTFVTGDAGGARVYIDGAQVAYVSFLGGNAYNPATNIFIGCRSDLSSTRFYGGKLDEVRILNVPRSADWISTEYTNQNNPTSYFSLGSLITASVICEILPIHLVSFEATMLNEKTGLIKWTVMKESEDTHYEIERSIDGLNYEKLASMKGKNSDDETMSYEVLDENLYQGINYYRIKILESNTPSYYTSIRALNNGEMSKTTIIPNPFKDYLIIKTKLKEVPEGADIVIFNQLGTSVKTVNHNGKNMMMLQLSDLPVGVYYFEIRGYDSRRYKVIKVNEN